MANRGMTFIIAMVLAGYAVAQTTPVISRFLPAGVAPDPNFTLSGYMLLGEDLENVWPCAPDFFFRYTDWLPGDGDTGHCLDDGTPKLYLRSLMLADKGDAADLAFRRAGPDNTDATGTPAPVSSNTKLGTIYWQGWGLHESIPEGDWKGGPGKNGRVAAITAQADGPQTATSRPGKICISTTPVGKGGDPIDRLCFNNTGQPFLYFNGTLKPVTVHGTGSCGSGFRCLRVPN